MIELKQRALEFVRRNGPILPVRLARDLNTTILFASAVLSELVSDKKIKISSTNIGGSPVYYFDGQERKLEILYKYLPSKEREAYDLLKRNKLLRDNKLEPAIRVALREIKDFSIRLNVNFLNNVEVFWKWYLISDNEAENIIRGLIEKERPKVKEVKIEGRLEKEKEEVQEKLKIKVEKEEKKVVKKELPKDTFFSEVEKYFNQNNIEIVSQEVIKKNREIDMVVKVPSNLGSLLYYVKARNKKTVSTADISLTYNIGQSQKLPVIYLSNAKLGKKVADYIEKNMRGYFIYKQL